VAISTLGALLVGVTTGYFSGTFDASLAVRRCGDGAADARAASRGGHDHRIGLKRLIVILGLLGIAGVPGSCVRRC
jgi:hypothetical protein